MYLLEPYERLLWGTMDVLGVSRSVARKVHVAVGIQFAISVAQAALPWIAGGETQTLLSALLLVGAVVAFLNTVLIVRRDVVTPIDQLSTSASAVAAGDLSTSPPTTDGDDEVAQLVEDFGDMHEHLQLVSAQATAMGRIESSTTRCSKNDFRASSATRSAGWPQTSRRTRGRSSSWSTPSARRPSAPARATSRR